MNDHDPLCSRYGNPLIGTCALCDVITEVRADERGHMRGEAEHYVTAITALGDSGHVVAACRCGWMDRLTANQLNYGWHNHLSGANHG